MAKQLENATTVVHFPLCPFGRHAGQREIVLTYGGPDVNADEIPPVSGCPLSDPLSDSDKARLCALSLAWIDAGGRFAVDYAALRAHLRVVCGVRDEDLPGLAWATIVRTIRKNEPDVPAPSESPDTGTKMTGEEKAVAILAMHPHWSNKQIAKASGVHEKRLYKYEHFKKIREIVKETGRDSLPHGFKTEEGDMEAYE